MVLTESIAKLCKQRIMGHIGQIGDFNRMGLSFATSCTDSDEMAAMLNSPSCQCSFCTNLVTCIQENHGPMAVHREFCHDF